MNWLSVAPEWLVISEATGLLQACYSPILDGELSCHSHTVIAASQSKCTRDKDGVMCRQMKYNREVYWVLKRSVMWTAQPFDCIADLRETGRNRQNSVIIILASIWLSQTMLPLTLLLSAYFDTIYFILSSTPYLFLLEKQSLLSCRIIYLEVTK